MQYPIQKNGVNYGYGHAEMVPGTMPEGALPAVPTVQSIPGAVSPARTAMGPVGMMMPGIQGPAPAAPAAPGAIVPGQLPLEQSFIENILRLNLGKVATIYMTFENNSQWNAKIFRGVLEAAGRDHIIISDPQTGMRYLLLMVNLDYITFDQPLNYYYPLAPVTGR